MHVTVPETLTSFSVAEPDTDKSEKEVGPVIVTAPLMLADVKFAAPETTRSFRFEIPELVREPTAATPEQVSV